MKNIISLNSNTYHGFNLDETIQGAGMAGFRYIELAAVRGYTEHVKWEMTDEEIKEVKMKLKDHNLECIALAGHSDLMTVEGVASFSKNIELAHRLDCKYITTSTGETHGDKNVIGDESELLTTLTALVAECEQYGIVLVVETHGNNYATGVAVKELARKVDSPYFGVNYDTANVIFYGNTMPYNDLEQSADMVKLIHLKDKLGKNDEWNFPAIGKGNIDFSRIFAILEQSGCTAPLSVEVEFTPDGPADLAEVNLAVEDSYKVIRQLLSV